jgi:hypothetical protein
MRNANQHYLITVAPRLHGMVAAQAYPLLFATISGRIFTD